jgi:hypothetical protein
MLVVLLVAAAAACYWSPMLRSMYVCLEDRPSNIVTIPHCEVVLCSLVL